MNGSRQAFSLLTRCRSAFVPRLPTKSCALNRCFVAESNGRLYSSSSSDESSPYPDELPKLPIENAWSFGMDMVGRRFKQMSWCIAEQNLERDAVFNTNEAAEEVLKFVTQCIVDDDFKTLEEKMTPEALNACQPLSLWPAERKKGILFTGASQKMTSAFLANELSYFSPWSFSTNNSSLKLSFLGFVTELTSNKQRAWLLSLLIPKEDTSLSDDFKVVKFEFSSYTPAEAGEEK